MMFLVSDQSFDGFTGARKTLDLVEDQKTLAVNQLYMQFMLKKHVESSQIVEVFIEDVFDAPTDLAEINNGFLRCIKLHVLLIL